MLLEFSGSWSASSRTSQVSFFVLWEYLVNGHGPLNSSFHKSGNLRHLVHGTDVRDTS